MSARAFAARRDVRSLIRYALAHSVLACEGCAMRLGEGIAETVDGRRVRELHQALSATVHGVDAMLVASAAAYLLVEHAVRGHLPLYRLHAVLDAAIKGCTVTPPPGRD